MIVYQVVNSRRVLVVFQVVQCPAFLYIGSCCDLGVFFSEGSTHKVLAPILKGDSGKVTDLIVCINCYQCFRTLLYQISILGCSPVTCFLMKSHCHKYTDYVWCLTHLMGTCQRDFKNAVINELHRLHFQELFSYTAVFTQQG